MLIKLLPEFLEIELLFDEISPTEQKQIKIGPYDLSYASMSDEDEYDLSQDHLSLKNHRKQIVREDILQTSTLREGICNFMTSEYFKSLEETNDQEEIIKTTRTDTWEWLSNYETFTHMGFFDRKNKILYSSNIEGEGQLKLERKFYEIYNISTEKDKKNKYIFRFNYRIVE